MGKTVRKGLGKRSRNGRLGQRNRRRDDSPGELADFPSGKLAYMVGRCRRKMAFSAYRDAFRAKKAKERLYDVTYSIYECPICGKWHLTTHPWERF